jgi:alkylation response protein AidB-like acyl-CoA dehydrogenase
MLKYFKRINNTNFIKLNKKFYNVFQNSETLSDTQISVQNAAYEFAKNELFPFAAEWDAKKHFPKDVYRKAAELGFACILF